MLGNTNNKHANINYAEIADNNYVERIHGE